MVRLRLKTRFALGLLLGLALVGGAGFVFRSTRNEHPGAAPVAPARETSEPTPQARRLKLQRAFDAEPRDEGWAGTIEREIGAKVVADVWNLFPQVLPRDFACRTSICRLRYRYQNGRDVSALKQLLIALRTADGYQSEPVASEAELYLYYSTEGDARDAAEIVRDYRIARAQVFADLRAGRTSLPGLRLADLPQE